MKFPVVVHCREADNDILACLNKAGNSSGVIHCFSSNLAFANSILKTGFHLSFTGMITFIKELTTIIKNIPLNKIMLETDSPYLSPIPYRGKTNEPSQIIHIAKKIASIKNITLEKVALSTTEVAHNLFTKLEQ